jgi:hypothetical protein
MYGPQDFDRGFRDLPDKSDNVMRRRRRAHHLRTQPAKQKLPRARGRHLDQAFRYLNTGELEDAQQEIDLDSEESRQALLNIEADEQEIARRDAIHRAYRTRLNQLKTLPAWEIYPEIAEQFRSREVLRRRYPRTRFWHWPLPETS